MLIVAPLFLIVSGCLKMLFLILLDFCWCLQLWGGLERSAGVVGFDCMGPSYDKQTEEKTARLLAIVVVVVLVVEVVVVVVGVGPVVVVVVVVVIIVVIKQ